MPSVVLIFTAIAPRNGENIDWADFAEANHPYVYYIDITVAYTKEPTVSHSRSCRCCPQSFVQKDPAAKRQHRLHPIFSSLIILETILRMTVCFATFVGFHAADVNRSGPCRTTFVHTLTIPYSPLFFHARLQNGICYR